MAPETKDTIEVKMLKHGHAVVGATAAKLTLLDFPCMKGVLLRAPGADDPVPNTAPIWIGSSAVTADSDPGTGGIPILPGESFSLPIDNPTDAWVVSTAADQDLAWLGV